jgi:hypothetical protein
MKHFISLNSSRHDRYGQSIIMRVNPMSIKSYAQNPDQKGSIIKFPDGIAVITWDEPEVIDRLIEEALKP